MKHIALTMIVGILGVAFIGFMPIDHGTHHGAGAMETPCLIAAILNTVCGQGEVPMAFVHISALQLFSHTPVPATFLFLSLFIIVGLAAFISYVQANLLSAQGIFIFLLWDVRRGAFPPGEKIRSWLSLLELSPARA